MNMVPSYDPRVTFAKFKEAHGPEKLAACYTTQLAPLPGEKHWDFYLGEELVAWGCVLNKGNGEYSYRAGVFPGHERKGYRKRIRYILALMAFGDPGCQVLRTSVRLNNPHQVDSMVRDARDKVWGEYAGLELGPPRLVFKLTREHFMNHIMRPEDKG